jgi:mannose-6-phosphate isomerase-like protein (cupin superfamily)
MLSSLLLSFAVAPQQAEAPSADQTAIQEVVDQLYAAVSYEAGTMPNWDTMANVFFPEAVLVMSYPEGSQPRIQSPKEFVQEYRDFLEQPGRNAQGFYEGPTYLEIMMFGNIAHVDAVFEAFLPPDSPVPVKRGIDSFQLLKVEGEWKILALTSAQTLGNRPLGEAPPTRIAINLQEQEETESEEASTEGFPAFERISIPHKSKTLAESGHRWLPVLYRATMHLGLYTLPAESQDTQNPHEEDEVYYVLRGRGQMTAGEETSKVEAGDLLYVDAGLQHHFHDIEEELEFLVFFSMKHLK